jgi:hypothetical protein
MSWRETLKQEWATARDDETRRLLLKLYEERLAKLPEREREEYLAELHDTTPEKR